MAVKNQAHDMPISQKLTHLSNHEQRGCRQRITVLVGIILFIFFKESLVGGGGRDRLITSGTLRATRLSPLQPDPGKSLSLSQLFFLSTQQRPRQLKFQGRVATQLLPSAFSASHRIASQSSSFFFFHHPLSHSCLLLFTAQALQFIYYPHLFH